MRCSGTGVHNASLPFSTSVVEHGIAGLSMKRRWLENCLFFALNRVSAVTLCRIFAAGDQSCGAQIEGQR